MIITAGKYKGRKITAPDEAITRPTLSKTRMGVFNSLFSILGTFENKSFLDVFGGSGIMGLEALSRGFLSVKVFELNRKSAEIIKKNYNMLNLNPEITIGDSVKILSKTNEYFDVIYIDPPYKSNLYESVLKIANGNIIIVEHSENVDFTGFKVLKQKNYGGSKITFLSKDIVQNDNSGN
jgi:16S rRNA (guanine(966)-N(2))-methyltransferase RsmD